MNGLFVSGLVFSALLSLVPLFVLGFVAVRRPQGQYVNFDSGKDHIPILLMLPQAATRYPGRFPGKSFSGTC